MLIIHKFLNCLFDLVYFITDKHIYIFIILQPILYYIKQLKSLNSDNDNFEEEEEDWTRYSKLLWSYDDLKRNNKFPQNLVIGVAESFKQVNIYKDWAISEELYDISQNATVYIYFCDTTVANDMNEIHDCIVKADLILYRICENYIIIINRNDNYSFDAIALENDEIHFLVWNRIPKAKPLIDLAFDVFQDHQFLDNFVMKPNSKLCSSRRQYRTYEAFDNHRDKIGQCCVLH